MTNDLKKAFENKVALEDACLTDIEGRIHKLEVERSFHVGLRTAYVNALAELEKGTEAEEE